MKETLKGGAIAGAGAVIGGMCGGPMGLAVGRFIHFSSSIGKGFLKSALATPVNVQFKVYTKDKPITMIWPPF